MPYSVTSRRSSSTRVATSTSEEGMELVLVGGDRVQLLGLELLARVHASPVDADREDAGRLRRAHVEGRVADVCRLLGPRAEQLERLQDRLGVRLVALGVVRGDDDVEVALDRAAREGEVDGR